MVLLYELVINAVHAFFVDMLFIINFEIERANVGHLLNVGVNPDFVLQLCLFLEHFL
jgi:hypothetical protein